jgi:hypothetical protein
MNTHGKSCNCRTDSILKAIIDVRRPVYTNTNDCPVGICQSPDVAQEVMELVRHRRTRSLCRWHRSLLRRLAVENGLARILAHSCWIKAIAKEGARIADMQAPENRTQLRSATIER